MTKRLYIAIGASVAGLFFFGAVKFCSTGREVLVDVNIDPGGYVHIALSPSTSFVDFEKSAKKNGVGETIRNNEHVIFCSTKIIENGDFIFVKHKSGSREYKFVGGILVHVSSSATSKVSKEKRAK